MLEDAHGALLPEAEVEIRVGSHVDREAPVSRQPDPVDVARILEPVDARLHGRGPRRGLVRGGIELS